MSPPVIIELSPVRKLAPLAVKSLTASACSTATASAAVMTISLPSSWSTPMPPSVDVSESVPPALSRLPGALLIPAAVPVKLPPAAIVGAVPSRKSCRISIWSAALMVRSPPTVTVPFDWA